jgi:RNA polymerase sigma factor (sigma-70 family)
VRVDPGDSYAGPAGAYLPRRMDGDESVRDDASSALEDHIRRFAGLLRHARRRHGLAPEDLDELVQEVRVRLWRARGTGEKISAVSSSYMYRTAMSAAVDLIRRRRHERHEVATLDEGVPRDALTDRSAGPDAGSEEILEAMGWALGRLARPRAVAVRMHLAGYSREEIGSILGWSEARTRNLIYRGLADLRARLTELGVGPEATG